MQWRSGTPFAKRCSGGLGRHLLSDDLAEKNKRCAVGSHLFVEFGPHTPPGLLSVTSTIPFRGTGQKTPAIARWWRGPQRPRPLGASERSDPGGTGPNGLTQATLLTQTRPGQRLRKTPGSDTVAYALTDLQLKRLRSIPRCLAPRGISRTSSRLAWDQSKVKVYVPITGAV